MPQRVISNTFALTAYIGSKTYVTTLVVDQGKLHQFYDKDNGGKCSPDWETSTAEQPKFHLDCRSTDGTPQDVEPSSLKLYYNENVIPFDSSTKLNTGMFAGMFKYEDVGSVRYYYIVKNIATAGNMDNDAIRIEGQIRTEGNNLETVSTPIVTIHVIPVTSGGSAYFMEIEAPAIKNGATSTDIVAHVYKSDGAGEVTSGVKWKWEKLNGTTYATAGTAQKLNVKQADVNGFEHYRCTATIGSVTVVGACSVFDYNDGIFIGYKMTGVGNPTNMKQSETATIEAFVADKDGTEKTDYTGTLTFTLVPKSGQDPVVKQTNPITLSGTDIITNYGGSVTGYITLE